MAFSIPQHRQEITVVVSGPEDANRLIICTGDVPMNSGVGPNTLNYPVNVTFLVGPLLQRGQFIRAVASAAITSSSFMLLQQDASSTTNPSAAWSVIAADADWDDESGLVQVRVECSLGSGANTSVMLSGISYNVSILAALPAS